MPKAKKKKSGGGGGLGRQVVGISRDRETGRYKKMDRDLEAHSTGIWRPSQGTNYASDDMVEFNMVVRADELVRFPENPFCLIMSAKHINSDFIGDAALQRNNAAQADAKRTENPDLADLTKTTWLAPQQNNPAVNLEGSLGGASFVDHLEVLVNGMPVDLAELGPHWYIWQGINRNFMSEQAKKLRYQGVPRCSTATTRMAPPQGTDAKDRKMPKDLLDSMETLQFDGLKTSKNKLLRFNIDGHWPFQVRTAEFARVQVLTHVLSFSDPVKHHASHDG